MPLFDVSHTFQQYAGHCTVRGGSIAAKPFSKIFSPKAEIVQQAVTHVCALQIIVAAVVRRWTVYVPGFKLPRSPMCNSLLHSKKTLAVSLHSTTLIFGENLVKK
ncbi:hypothetical protein [Oxalicibacterium sp.]|uniref:hypothetical protein n=1 Tax=Oxalicibacterium sp. TaxID=2766525 RepID=UPI002D7EACE0|nr:hypothetical protein [Oxalicibacterium sp.]